MELCRIGGTPSRAVGSSMLPSRAAPLLAAALVLGPAARAQTGATSAIRSVAITATKVASVGITLPAGASLVLPGSLSSGVNDFSPLPFTTSWSIDQAQTARVSVVAYFEAPGQALTSGGAAIPTTAILGRVPSGSQRTFAPFTQTSVVGNGSAVGVAGGSLTLVSESIAAQNAIGERTDQLQMRIDLTGSPALPPGTYAGTLNLVAITQ
jgi:hypothetical protein